MAEVHNSSTPVYTNLWSDKSIQDLP